MARTIGRCLALAALLALAGCGPGTGLHLNRNGDQPEERQGDLSFPIFGGDRDDR